MFALRDHDVEEVFAWFEQCYDTEVDQLTGRVHLRRVALPTEGGVGDQDARLINSMTQMAAVQQQVLDDEARRATRNNGS